MIERFPERTGGRMTNGSQLSIVLVVLPSYAAVRRLVERLREQTLRERIELVFVTESASCLADREAEALAGFCGHRDVFVGKIGDPERAAPAGIEAASAPVVALLEDHAYPEPDFTERIVERHREGWAGVGPAVLNANPRHVMSWVNHLIAYGRWPVNGRGGETHDIARHNSAFDRGVLLSYGDRLVGMMGRTGNLLRTLVRDGHRLYFEPAARVWHVNPSRVLSTFAFRYRIGRGYAGWRSEGWAPARRWLYVLGTPLMPFYRLVHERRVLRGGLGALRFAAYIPALFLALTVDALGQMVGYLAGQDRATRDALDALEVGRYRHVTSGDRRALGSV